MKVDHLVQCVLEARECQTIHVSDNFIGQFLKHIGWGRLLFHRLCLPNLKLCLIKKRSIAFNGTP